MCVFVPVILSLITDFDQCSFFGNFLIYQSIFWSIKFQKMFQNVDQCFPKTKMTSSNILCFPSQSKSIHFTVSEE